MFGPVINASNIISAFCYSLVRVEPYTACSHKCIYCYVRWRIPNSQKVDPCPEAVKVFGIIARKLRLSGIRPIPARLSTLSDPFQPQEAKSKLSLKVLNVALREGYPIIVNTKGTLLSEEPWLTLLKDLASEKLVIIQASLSSMNDETARIIEPYAPPPSARLKTLGKLSAKDIPVVVRLSPYIPGLTLKPSPERVVEALAEAGVKHVTVESLRIEAAEAQGFFSLLGLNRPPMEAYSLRLEDDVPPLLKPDLKARLPEYLTLRALLEDHGISFATCKEGLFSLHTAEDCCGIYMLEGYAIRPTLYDLYLKARRQHLSVKQIMEVFSNLPQKYVFGERLKAYPRILRKPLKSHEKKLIKILASPEILQRLTPELSVEENGRLKAKPILQDKRFDAKDLT